MTTAIILAGGLGTRLRSEVPNLPKPMAIVKNRPFLEYLMDYWIEQGVCKFILSIGYLSEKIVSHFGGTYKNIPISYSIEKSPLGTGGGLLLSLKKITQDTTKSVYEYIPLQNFNEVYDDKKLYKKYKLEKKEIDFIESIVHPENAN